MSQSSTESFSIPPSSQAPPPPSSMDYYDPPQRHHFHHHHPSTPNAQISARTAALNPPPLLSHSSTLSQASTAAYSIRDSPDIDERPSSPYFGRDSPPPSITMSATNTPIVPPSGTNPQYNPFPGSPSIAAGSKRTASGTVKNTFPNSVSSIPNSPAAPVTPRVARMHMGIDASPKNVSQISTQLRTRLTYALLKLENNWASESLDQVEARISQGQHPTSPSPRVRIKREPSAGDERGSAPDMMRRHTRTNSEPNTAHPLGVGGGATYESFWRDHQPIRTKLLQASHALGTSTSTNVPHLSAPMTHAIHRGRLQPPAQIIPDRDRRSYYNPPRHPPTLTPSGSNLSTYSNYSTASSASIIANTPPPAGAAAQRTMEQDAVESLMFLSSPGNSRPSSQQTISTVHTPQHSQHSQHSQPPVATFHLSPSSQQNPSYGRYNYSRNATTWPRDRARHKQARTGLEGLGVTVGGGMQEEDDATDEETGPDSVNARIREGGRGGKFDGISPIERAARQRGETAGVSSRMAHNRGGRVGMGGIGGSPSTAAAPPGARGVAGVGGC